MKEHSREAIAFSVVALFAYAFWRNPSEQLMLGAIIAAFTTATGFYLGGSKVGSDTATKNADTLRENATAASSTTDLQHVVVDQPADKPVPVKERG